MNKKKLWQVDQNQPNPLVEEYTVGDDYIFDQFLLQYDIEASLAHAEMLFKIDVFNKDELIIAKKGLNEILEKQKKGNFIIYKNQEDGHTAIEQYLTEKYGEIGKKIHTGRSRNDQSLVMIRLFMKDKLFEIKKEVDKLVQIFKNKSQENKTVKMPGYTHLQKAMPTTVGLWLDSFLCGLKDFNYSLDACLKIIDQNPLGSASGFGIDNFFIDKDFTSKKLNFKKTQNNPLYCAMSRGYFENIVLQTLSQPIIISAKFANDMLLFTTQEFDFFALPNSFTSGSSIMPQKRNYDLFEIMRGNAKVYLSYQNEIQNIISSIGSGYQRDLQLTKKPLIFGVNLCLNTIKLMLEIVPALEVKKENLKKSMTEDLYVTNQLYDMVNQGIPFREAYINIKKKWGKL